MSDNFSRAIVLAGPIELLKARLLGRKFVTADSGVTVTSYLRRGILYVTRIDVDADVLRRRGL